MESKERSRTKSSIDELQARGDLFTRQLINEKQRMGQLQVKLNDVNEKIAALRDSNKRKAMHIPVFACEKKPSMGQILGYLLRK